MENIFYTSLIHSQHHVINEDVTSSKFVVDQKKIVDFLNIRIKKLVFKIGD